MLVLTRKTGEAIRIGSGIEVTVLSVSKGRVRLGLTAPREVPVHRAEVAQLISMESATAPRETAPTNHLLAMSH
jgi:carbon storage regulator